MFNLLKQKQNYDITEAKPLCDSGLLGDIRFKRVTGGAHVIKKKSKYCQYITVNDTSQE